MCCPAPSKSRLFPNILDKAPALLFRFHCNLDMSFPNRPLQSPFTITPPFPFSIMRPLRPAFLHGHHLLKMQKPRHKGRGSRGTTFINRINDSLGTYGKGTVSPFDTLLLITERTSRLRLLPVSAKRFRSPFGIRRASVHTSHRLS